MDISEDSSSQGQGTKNRDSLVNPSLCVCFLVLAQRQVLLACTYWVVIQMQVWVSC